MGSIYTPLRNTAPDKYTSPSYVNSLALKSFSTENTAAQLNAQHRNLAHNFVVKGFDIIVKGMSIIVSNGVCVFKYGQSIKYQTSGDNNFFINDTMPNDKTLGFYLAIGRTNNRDGDAVLGLFRSEKISNDWLVLKKLTLLKNSASLSELEIKNLYAPYGIRIYNFIPNQPDGSIKAFKIPFEIDGESVRFVVNGEIYDKIGVRRIGSLTEVISDDILSASDRVLLDFTAYS